MSDSDLFEQEEETQQHYQKLVADLESSLESICPKAEEMGCTKADKIAHLKTLVKNLLKEYKKLYRQSRRLVKLGDMQQEKITETNKALAASQRWLEIHNRFIRNTFGRYLSDEIVDSILDTSEGLELGGEDRVVTILMTDLRGFTAMSERLSAEAVVGVINVYLGIMTEIIQKYAGIIDEILGDAILVIFGAPIARENDPQRAVACALEMQLAMTKVNQNLCQSGYSVELSMGIGINTGSVVVGNIGSQARSKYAVVGKNVNLTARIESYTVGGQVLISESTRQPCEAILRIDEQMEVTPKGVQTPITIYSIGGIHGDYNIHLPDPHKLELKKPVGTLSAHFIVLQEKHAGKEFFGGTITGVSKEAIEIRTPASVAHLANLKITVWYQKQEITSELFGKVTKIDREEECAILRVTITALPVAAEKLFATH